MRASSDLQTLLANLKPRSSPAASAANGQSDQHSSSHPFNSNTYLQSQASPALASPPVAGSSSIQRSRMTSPAADQAASAGGNEKSKSLLNLLKFGQPSALGNVTQQHPDQLERPKSESQSIRQETAYGKNLAASQLTASFQTPQSTPGIPGGGNVLSGGPTSSSTHEETHAPKAGETAQESSQDVLLKLLNRSASSGQQPKVAESNREQPAAFTFGSTPATAATGVWSGAQSTAIAQENSPVRNSSPVRMFGSSQSRETTPFEPPATTAPRERKPLFTYTNPFDALHASRNATPQPSGQRTDAGATTDPDLVPGTNTDQKRASDAAPTQIFTRRKLMPKVPLRASSSAEPCVKNEGAPDKSEPIAPGGWKAVKQEETDATDAIDTIAKKFGETAIDLDVGAKVESDKKANQNVLEPGRLNSQAGASKDASEEVAANVGPANGVASSIEPAQATPRDVPVYNFPLKPFVSITITDMPPSKVGLLDDGGVMEISRFKKEFDQLDRTLASATSKYITYAFVKNGGVRVIRQDDGRDRQVFKNSGDRIFHVTLCTTAQTSPPTDEQGVLGVGLSGAVYYTTISKNGDDLFENDDLDAESLVFPPYPPGDENSSGGTFKTRVRRSSRHPEFFAIGRGKAIHLVWPSTALCTKYGVSGSNRKVDVEKLYKDRPLKVVTGKAGKDFIFSEDDTAIVSLDKTGKLSFWDIRNLVNESTATASKVQVEEVKFPIFRLPTAIPSEKSWPTSVLFVDKLRPYTKATALRYILVGLKQNHTLQLWDIALEKAVQELNFPHQSETDGICSVAYHASSGTIVVGHPTRNSIFFLSLSAPRYRLQPMSQATYLERVASKDSTLPRPEATACISGMREMSFASKGQLRSVDLLPIRKAADAPKEAVDTEPLFELYAVHSKGVTCLTIKNEDLGWGPDGKILHHVDDAVETGLISVAELRRPPSSEEAADINGSAGTPQASKTSKKRGSKASTETAEAPSTKHKLEQFPPVPLLVADHPNGVKSAEEALSSGETPADKEKRKKKRKPDTGNIPTLSAANPPHNSKSPSRPLSPSKTTAIVNKTGNRDISHGAIGSMASDQPSSLPQSSVKSEVAKEHVGASVPKDLLEKEINKLGDSISTEFSKQLERLYDRFEEDRRVQDAVSSSRQEGMLRLVSSTLSSNVENSLSRIVGEHMQQVVLPAVTNITSQAIRVQVGDALGRVLHTLMPQEIGNHLPSAISTSLQNPTLIRSLTDNVSKALVPSLESHYTELMRSTIGPAFQRLATTAAEKATGEIENRVGSKLRQYELDRQNDAAKAEMLQASMQQMMEMLGHLSEGQVAFQEKILSHMTESGSRPSSGTAGPFQSTSSNTRQISSAQRSFPAPSMKTKTPEEMEAEEIGSLLGDGKFEEASIKWLQSGRAVQLFDEVFVNYTPDYLDHAVSPLVAFSVGITVANSFEHNVHARLDWIYTSLNTVDIRDPEIMALTEHAPPLLTSLISKLEQLLETNSGRESLTRQMIVKTINNAKEVTTKFSR